MKRKSTVFYGSLLLLECFIWGVGNPIMKIGLEVVPPLFCLAVRYLLAFLLLLPFFAKRLKANMTRKQIIPYLIISACTAAAFITSAFSLIYTTATNAGFLMSTAVLFTPFLSYFVLKSKLDKKHALPIAIVIVGLYLLCSGDGRFTFGLGEFFGILCAIAGACMLVFSSKYLQDNDPFTVTVMQTGFTGLFCVIFALIFEDIPSLGSIPMIGWGVIIYLAVGCTCIAYLLQNIALRKVPATYVAMSFCSEPIFTAAASYFLLREVLSMKGVIGAGLIMTSIIMASLMPEDIPEKQIHQLSDKVNEPAVPIRSSL
ncbi:DMT family transporter [Anoxybacterium hadale]|uniref:DMT family transporter n=1 Tax=Anoxybacterium hadale TaxID=3408580 RepID=A0ACD1AB52_9FIRM|nr:DMT family transporter [Clostridiales bacterium]